MTALPGVSVERGTSQYGRHPAGDAMVQAAIGLTLFGATESVLLVVGPGEPTRLILAFPAMAGLYGATGLWAWRRRPRNRTGMLLTLGAWTWLLAGFANVDEEILVAVGQLSATLPFAVIVHMVLAFPSGHLPDRASRLVVAAAYVTTGVLEVSNWLFVESSPSSPLLIRSDPSLARLAVIPQKVAVPVSAQVVAPLTGIDPITRVVAQLVVLAVVPLAFAAAVVRGGFARTGELSELAAALGGERREQLREALADMLGDPTLELGFWLPSREVYVDDHGGVVGSEPEVGRADADITVDSGPVGRIRYSEDLVDDAALVVEAGRVLAVAVDRRRLDLELVAANHHLQESRGRLVAAAEDERRRIAADLHDGLQGRLVVLGIHAQRLLDRGDSAPGDGSVCSATVVRDGLVDAIAEVRRLVQGVMPSVLVERGLAVAVADLVDRMPMPTVLEADGVPLPLGAPVETTAYLVVAESLANSLKHSSAHHLQVRLAEGQGCLCVEVADDGIGGATITHGSGLRSLADRVGALGGRLTIESAPGLGTRVRAEVPCGS